MCDSPHPLTDEPTAGSWRRRQYEPETIAETKKRLRHPQRAPPARTPPLVVHPAASYPQQAWSNPNMGMAATITRPDVDPHVRTPSPCLSAPLLSASCPSSFKRLGSSGCVRSCPPAYSHYGTLPPTGAQCQLLESACTYTPP
jgi:hypothetical protein